MAAYCNMWFFAAFKNLLFVEQGLRVSALSNVYMVKRY